MQLLAFFLFPFLIHTPFVQSLSPSSGTRCTAEFRQCYIETIPDFSILRSFGHAKGQLRSFGQIRRLHHVGVAWCSCWTTLGDTRLAACAIEWQSLSLFEEQQKDSMCVSWAPCSFFLVPLFFILVYSLCTFHLGPSLQPWNMLNVSSVRFAGRCWWIMVLPLCSMSDQNGTVNCHMFPSCHAAILQMYFSDMSGKFA